MLTTVRHNPGPGAYDPKTSITPNGNYFIASMRNSGAPFFSLPKVGKGSTVKVGGRDGSPGPGSYNIKTGISDNADRFISTFHAPKTRTFYHSDRKTIDIPKALQSKNFVNQAF